MNKKAIWITTGIMGVALMGTVILQFYWINWSLKLKEKQFDDTIIAALKRVSDRLENENENWEINEINRFFQEMGNSSANQKKIIEYATRIMNNKKTVVWDTSSLLTIGHSRDKEIQFLEYIDRQMRMHPASLEQRISPQKLAALIKQEFKDLLIDLEYSFGIYDNTAKSFVILNDNYVVNFGENPKVSNPNFDFTKYLIESSYQVAVFPNSNGSPGVLKVFFPSKKSFLWRSVLPILLLSLLFTVIILACFSYVIYVVFRQKKLSEIKNDFVNNMTHEFKTPIATISLASDSILSPMVIHEPDKIRRFTDIIKQENRRMLSQVEKVLQMALLDKHDFQLNFKQINIHEIIEQAVKNINLQVQQREGHILQELKATHFILKADQTHMTNIIYNLLDNANKYSESYPEITISTRNVPRGIEIKVSDKGIGMKREDQKMIFEKFYRVPTGNLHNVKGFGLGLSYVKAMVQAHDGSIEVSSEIGKGSTFIINLPI